MHLLRIPELRASDESLQLAELRRPGKTFQRLLWRRPTLELDNSAAIVDRAIGDRLHPIFVDHGFLRLDEGDKVVKAWKGHFKSKLVRVNAAKRFLDLIKGVGDPERKRKLIGREFIKVFDEESRKHKQAKFLAQGTALYWDRYVKEGGRWLIRETRYRRIYEINTALLENPQLSSHYLSEFGTEVSAG